MQQQPPLLLDHDCCLGIDEAGRGPVLGPMVYAASWCPLDRVDDLKKIGVMDSKMLTEANRDKLFDALKKCGFVGWYVDILSADVLSRQMLRKQKKSLNEISHDSAIGLIQKALNAGVRVKEVFVDTVGTPEKYQAKLSAMFPDIKFKVEKKADATYPCVSAASIFAKVTRDDELKYWEYEEPGITFDKVFGSGYPSDGVTKDWVSRSMDKVFGFPSLVRFSWKPVKDMLKEKAVPVVM